MEKLTFQEFEPIFNQQFKIGPDDLLRIFCACIWRYISVLKEKLFGR